DLPGAARMASLLGDSACRGRWQQALWDADHLAVYNDGAADIPPDATLLEELEAVATWKSHFYDPDTGLNWEGEADPTGRTEATRFLADASTKWRGGDADGACYALGLALHHMTDLTQPMHASNFTALDRAALLHNHVEVHALDVQTSFVH